MRHFHRAFPMIPYDSHVTQSLSFKLRLVGHRPKDPDFIMTHLTLVYWLNIEFLKLCTYKNKPQTFMHCRSSVCKYQFFASIISLSSQPSDLSKSSWAMFKKVKSPWKSNLFCKISLFSTCLDQVALHISSCSPWASRVRNWWPSRNCGAIQGASFAHLGPSTPNISKSCIQFACSCLLIFAISFQFCSCWICFRCFSVLLAGSSQLQSTAQIEAQQNGTNTAKSRPFAHVTTTSQTGFQLVVTTATEHWTPSVFGLQRIDSSTEAGWDYRSINASQCESMRFNACARS